MLTINERRVGEVIVLDLNGTLLIPDDDVALLRAVSRCVGNGDRFVVLNIAGLARIDAGGLGALIRSRNLLVPRDGELRLVNPTKFVGEVLRRTMLDSIIPTFRAEPSRDERSNGDGPVAPSADNPLWWEASLSDATA
jgi:anti-anti-sigma factor